MKELLKKWIAFARADLEAASVQLRYGRARGGAYQVAVFHCHQAIEKILKAHLIAQDKEAPKVHDLTRLRVLVGIALPPHLQDFIDELQPHYLLPRYPDLPFAPGFSFAYNRKNAEDIIHKTTELFVWLEKILTREK